METIFPVRVSTKWLTRAAKSLFLFYVLLFYNASRLSSRHVYTECNYTGRIECLMDLPKGKTLIHFEDADLVKAKKLLGDVACLCGGVSSRVLVAGTSAEVADAVKRNLDILASGGGCMFDISDSMENCKAENVETMFETVKSYGKF